MTEAPGTPRKLQILEPLALPAFDRTRPLGRQEEAPSSPAPTSFTPHGPPAALLVCHGMGQQVRFETLEQLAHCVTHPDYPDVGIRRVTIGSPGEELYRIEMTMADREGEPREVHLYEAYWAPVTEGRVGIRDVLGFLLRAAWNAIRHTEGDVFQRWMFGRTQSLPIRAASTRLRLAAAGLAILSLIAINTFVSMLVLSRIIGGPSTGWPDQAFLRLLFWELAALAVVLAVPAAMLIGIHKRSGKVSDPKQPPPKHPATRVALFGAVGAIILVGAAIAVSAALTAGPWFHTAFAGWKPLGPWMKGFLAFLWAVTLGVSAMVRFFLIQYVGDVAAYVSANWVDKFSDVRKEIQKISCGVATAIYTAREGARFAYGDVLVVGHSLGSVVAYDTLNAMLRDGQTAAMPLDVARRTRSLVTFGSPLNKTAFIFSTQMHEGDEVREALANAVQPLIQSYDHRPEQWINLYSSEDWIGGKIEFYDDHVVPATSAGARSVDDAIVEKRVRNVEDLYANTPLGAHTEHWASPQLKKVLSEALPAASEAASPFAELPVELHVSALDDFSPESMSRRVVEIDTSRFDDLLAQLKSLKLEMEVKDELQRSSASPRPMEKSAPEPSPSVAPPPLSPAPAPPASSQSPSPQMAPAPASEPMKAPLPRAIPPRVALSTGSTGAPGPEATTSRAAPPAPAQDGGLYEVWFATNRMRMSDPDPARRFGPALEAGGVVHHGRCMVEIPKTHKFGSVGTAWWKRWRKLQFADDHLRIRDLVECASPDEAIATMRDRILGLTEDDRQALVYLHGYNVSFEGAALRAAQIGFDLKVPGITAFFSWPSTASLEGYFADRERVEASENAITEFLVRLARESGARTVHLLAHSMGNYGLARAVQRIAARAADAAPLRFGQIILAAPDVSVQLFQELAQVYPRLSTRTTMYASARDRALGLSRFLQDAARAGYTPPITVVPGIDTVEVTSIDLTLLGHGYYAEAEPVLYDIQQLLAEDAPPKKRLRLRSVKSTDGSEYWQIGA